MNTKSFKTVKVKYYFKKRRPSPPCEMHMISISPSGKYALCEKNGTFYCFKVIYADGDSLTGELAGSHGAPFYDDENIFSGVHWAEEYGFLKLLFFNWLSDENIVSRLYFDRPLYEREKERLHPKTKK